MGGSRFSPFVRWTLGPFFTYRAFDVSTLQILDARLRSFIGVSDTSVRRRDLLPAPSSRSRDAPRRLTFLCRCCLAFHSS